MLSFGRSYLILHPTTMSLSKKLSITDVELKDKRVLIRVDFNVPIQDAKITNPAVSVSMILFLPIQFAHLLLQKRIVAALPTINYALQQSAYQSPFIAHGILISFLVSSQMHAP